MPRAQATHAFLLLFVTAGATAAVVAASTPKHTVAPPTTTRQTTTTAAPTTTTTATTTPAATATTATTATTTAATPTAPQGLFAWPAGASGYTDVLESIPLASGRAFAVTRALAAQRQGLPAVGVLVSSDYPSLHPGYYVVFSGIYPSSAAAGAALGAAHSHGFTDAYQARVAG